MAIHPSAVVDTKAKVASSAEIGPFCVVGPDVHIAEHVVLHSHVNVVGHTRIGAHTQVFPFASLGTPPQDLKFKGEVSTLEIGEHCMIREHVTMNPGTEGGGLSTKVGDRCLFMMGAHVAHDCQVGNHVILANNATLAGHVHVGDGAILGGLSAIHQFVRIGAGAMIGGMSAVEKDVIPFGSIMGERASLAGLNLIGLKRRGVERESIHALRNAYKKLFESNEGTLADRVADMAKEEHPAEVMHLLSFLQGDSDRSFCTPK